MSNKMAYEELEQHIEDLEKILFSTFDSLDGLLVVINRDRQIVLSNWKGHEFVQEEQRNSSPYCYQIFKHLDAPCDLCPPMDTFADGKPRKYEDRNPVDGSYKNIQVTPIFNTNKEVSLVMESVQDITEQKKLESQLIRAKKEWEQAFDIINDAITIHDKDFNIIRANKTAESLLGLPMNNILSQKCFTTYHGTQCPPEQCPSCTTMKTGIPSVTEFFEPHLNKYVEVKALPIFDKNKDISGAVHIVRDIDGRIKAEEAKKKLESQLMQAQKMEAIGTLAGGIAHDFNNVLTPILGYAEITKYKLAPNSPIAKNLDQIILAGNHAKDLIKQILTFSRQTDTETTPIKIQQLVKEVTKMLRAFLPTTIAIRQNIDNKCRPVLANPTQIHQLLMNLCTNASHAMEDSDGILTIQLKEVTIKEKELHPDSDLSPGPFAKLTIKDTGHGIEQTHLERIFDPYFTTKEAGKGTGMGLAVVHGIINSLLGKIDVVSEQGKGTTFHIYLPVIESEKISISEKPDLLPTGSEHILFVDDEEIITSTFEYILESLGYTVTAVNISSDALAIFKKQPEAFDLVISDQTMPNLSGTNLSKELLKINPKIPIILCTGYNPKLTEDIVRKIGIREFTNKPLTVGKLAHMIRRVIDSK